MSYKLSYTGPVVQEILDNARNSSGSDGQGYSIYPLNVVLSNDATAQTIKLSDITKPYDGWSLKAQDLVLSTKNGVLGQINTITGTTATVRAIGNFGAGLVYTGNAIDITYYTIALKIRDFNRVPAVGDRCIVIGYEDSNTYLCNVKITRVDTIDGEVDINVVDRVKTQGATALEYRGSVLNLTDMSIPTSIYLDFSNFNRNPIAGDSCIIMGYDNSQSYLFNARIEVSDVSNKDARVRLESKMLVRGPQGKQGVMGVAGLEYLGVAINTKTPIAVKISDFNRKPAVGNGCIMVGYDGDESYLCNVKITSVNGSTGDVGANIVSKIATRGAIGATGEQGIGIVSASLGSVEATEEYTTSNITLRKTDGSSTSVGVKARNGAVYYVGTVTESDWTASTTYSAYGYQYEAIIAYTGSTPLDISACVPEVIPTDVEDILNSTYAPFCDSVPTGVKIYSKKKPISEKTFNVSLSRALS